jgi:tripartite-type tricarboxylate transporter receptor subunit TctC
MVSNRNDLSRRGFLAGATATLTATAGCVGSLPGTGGSGNQYPSEDMRYIVPFSQGGGTDTYARQIGPALSEEAGVGVAVENIPGASSLRGTRQLLNAQPDGYTFGAFNPPSTPISYLVYNPGWNIKNLVPVATYGRTPYAVFANPDLGIKGLPDLVSRYKSGDLTQFAGLGRGGIVHVAANVMRKQYDLAYKKYVGYDGAGPAIQAAVSGEVPVVATTDTAAVSAVESNDLSPVAILSSQGSSVFPEAPSPTDFGLASIDYIGQLTRGMYLPAGTPTDVRDTLSNNIKSVLQRKSIQNWSKKTGNVVEYGGPKRARKALVNSLDQISKKVDINSIVNK